MIIGNGPVITNDPANPFVRDGAVVVRGDGIVAVGPAAGIRAAHPDEEMVDVGGRVIMAGLVNAHTHAYSAYARGMAVHQPTRDFTEILQNLWWRLDRLLTLEDVEMNAGTTFIESIRNGVTTVFDHHSSPHAVSGSLQTIADVAGRLGIRTSLCYETSDRDGAGVLAAAIEENTAFMKKVNTGEQDLVKGLFGLHASFTLSEKSLDAVCAAKEGVTGGFHVHVAESAGDEADSQTKYGKRVVQRFDDHAMLGPGTIAAHCVHADPDELELLRARDTSVVHNPHSNMGNAVGVASVVDMLDRGLRVGLGTDAYTPDILASAQVAKILASDHLGDPTVGFGQALQLAFVNNPKICAKFFRKEVGVLKAGAYADLITVAYLPFTPLDAGSAGGHILFGMSGSQVNDTMVNGSWVMRDRDILTVDEAGIFARSAERAPRIWAQM
ncbi:MAG TPA: putative aminohydrolase SsnA [Dermatophilaceae bacterium]|nr:putative aminohydrolase SsnA [Dermatophilaceae bacterium]